MTLEQQVTSLDWSRCLKELGARQELFEGDCYFDHSGRLFCWTEGEDKPYSDYVKAFSVAELGEMLPDNVYSGKDHAGIVCWRFNDSTEFHATSEADARTKMLTYLVGQKLITLP